MESSEKMFLSARNIADLFRAWCSDTKQFNPDAQLFETFRTKLRERTTETTFSMRSNRVGGATVATLVRILEECPTVNTIDLHENTIRDGGVQLLIKLMMMQPKEDAEVELPEIIHLDVGSNDIGPEGARKLSDFLQDPMCKLQTLILGSQPGELYANKLDHISGYHLAEALKMNSTLTHLDLNRNELLGKKSQEAFLSLADTLHENRNLVKLCLAATNLSTASAVAVISSLVNYYSLTYLDLSSNNLKSDAALAMGEVFLRGNCRIETLLMQDNSIGSAGLEFLCKSLKDNNSLKKLDVSRNNLYSTAEPDGIDALADLLMSPNALQAINLSQNGLDEGAAITLADAIASNRNLKHLNLSSNLIRNEGVAAIANALAHHSSLRALDLSTTGVANEGAEAIGHALLTNQTLVRLHLSDNHLSNAAASFFVDILEHNKKLIRFEVLGNQIDHTLYLRMQNHIRRNRRILQDAEPNRLRKKLIRLQYIKLMAQKASDRRDKCSRSRRHADALVDDQQDEIDKLVTENELSIEEKTTKIELTKTIIEELKEKAIEQEKEKIKIEKSSAELMQSLEEDLKKKMEERELQEKELEELEAELDRLVNRTSEVVKEFEAEYEEKNRKLEKMKEDMHTWRIETVNLEAKIGKLSRRIKDKSKLDEIDAQIAEQRKQWQAQQENQNSEQQDQSSGDNIESATTTPITPTTTTAEESDTKDGNKSE